MERIGKCESAYIFGWIKRNYKQSENIENFEIHDNIYVNCKRKIFSNRGKKIQKGTQNCFFGAFHFL